MLLFAYLSSSQALADRRRTAVVCFFVYALLITHLPLAMGVALQKDDKETESVVVTFDELKADGILGIQLDVTLPMLIGRNTGYGSGPAS